MTTHNQDGFIEKVNNVHINNFDWIRIVAAVTVLYGHAFPLTNTASLTILDNSIQATAVKIFFVVSGYLVCLSWMSNPNIIHFVSKRVLRIFPGLIVVVAFSALIVGPLVTSLTKAEYFSNPNFYKYFFNLILYPIYNLPGVFSNLPYKIAVNGSLWSLPIEFFMYLLLPILITISGIKTIKYSLIIFTVATCVASLVFLRSSFYELPRIVIYGSSVRSAIDVCPYFLIGAAYARYDLKKYLNIEVALAGVCILALLQPSSLWMRELCLYFILPYTVLSFAMSGQRLFSIIGKFGDFSYGVYLYGFLIEQLLNQIFRGELTALQDAFYSLPVTFILAILSWKFVERPCLRLKLRLAKK